MPDGLLAGLSGFVGSSLSGGLALAELNQMGGAVLSRLPPPPTPPTTHHPASWKSIRCRWDSGRGGAWTAGVGEDH